MHSLGGKFPGGIPRDLAVVAAAMLIWGVGEGLFIFFLPLVLEYWGASSVQTGAVLSLIGVMMAVVQVPAGILSDRFGSRPLVLAALCLGISAALAMAAATSLPFFVAGLLAYGLTSFVTPPLNSTLTRLRGNWSVQRALTFASAAMQVGMILGPFLGGQIAERAGMPVIFRFSAGLFLASTLLISLAGQPDAPASQESILPFRNPLAAPRFLAFLGLVFFTVFALSTPQQLTSLYLQDIHHLSIQQIGLLGTVASTGTAVIMFSLGGLNPPGGMLVGQLLIAGFALFMWQGTGFWPFFAGYFLVGGYRLYRAMALAFARSLVRAREIGLAYGLVDTGSALAIIAAPLAAGWLYGIQPEAMYTVSLSAMGITITLNGLLLIRGRRKRLLASG